MHFNNISLVLLVLAACAHAAPMPQIESQGPSEAAAENSANDAELLEALLSESDEDAEELEFLAFDDEDEAFEEELDFLEFNDKEDGSGAFKDQFEDAFDEAEEEWVEAFEDAENFKSVVDEAEEDVAVPATKSCGYACQVRQLTETSWDRAFANWRQKTYEKLTSDETADAVQKFGSSSLNKAADIFD